MNNRLDISNIDLEKYKNKCLLIEKGTCRNVNIFLEQVDIDSRLKQCIRNIAYEINSNWGEDCQSIIDAILQEIEKVKDIL